MHRRWARGRHPRVVATRGKLVQPAHHLSQRSAEPAKGTSSNEENPEDDKQKEDRHKGRRPFTPAAAVGEEESCDRAEDDDEDQETQTDEQQPPQESRTAAAAFGRRPGITFGPPVWPLLRRRLLQLFLAGSLKR
jgi:hypothetical protein